MEALTFWKTVTMDTANLLERLMAFLRERGIRFCVIGGQAVNAYVEPLVSLDLHRGSKRQKDLADIARLIERYPHLRVRVPTEILTRLEL
ncbi:MAG: hypothetical protein NZP34_07855 [Caldilineales bacterium]|nr:hypothetical protein [Caldilineales bacterium]MCX7853880.1 hypothetical protein [Caldilineales bacterium]